MFGPNGNLQDANVVANPTAQTRSGNAALDQYHFHSIQIGQITNAYGIDDKRNISKKYVEYDVLVNENRISLTTYRNCRNLDDFGGTNNFNEVVLAPSKEDSKSHTLMPSQKLGAMVILGCISGRKGDSIILKAIQHPAIRQGNPNTPVPSFQGSGNSDSRDDDLKDLPTFQPGAATGDGQRILGEFNGFRWEINSSGELTAMFQGAKRDDGTIINPKVQPTILKFNIDGELFLLDNLDQEIKISPKNKTIRIASGDGDVITIDRDKHTISLGSQKIETTSTKDTSLTVGATLTEDVTQDLKQTVGGNWNITVSGNAKIDASGTCDIKAAIITLNNAAGGQILTTITSPIVDAIFGAPTVGVPTVTAG